MLAARYRSATFKMWAQIRVPVGVKKEGKGKGRQFQTLGFHSLRHSFVSRLANAEVSADVRKQIVGHSSDEIHQRYVHLELALQKSALSKLEAFSEPHISVLEPSNDAGLLTDLLHG
jgi:integrase